MTAAHTTGAVAVCKETSEHIFVPNGGYKFIFSMLSRSQQKHWPHRNNKIAWILSNWTYKMFMILSKAKPHILWKVPKIYHWRNFYWKSSISKECDLQWMIVYLASSLIKVIRVPNPTSTISKQKSVSANNFYWIFAVFKNSLKLKRW